MSYKSGFYGLYPACTKELLINSKHIYNMCTITHVALSTHVVTLQINDIIVISVNI